MSKDSWDRQHLRYQEKDWIDQPSLFAQSMTKYLPNGGKLLDLGAGQGQDSRFFAKLGFEVTSTDFSPQALELNRQKAEIDALNIEIKPVDLNVPLEFASESFDVIYSHLALHYFSADRTRELFQELATILKPSGRLLALFNTFEDPEISSLEPIEEDYYRETKSGLAKRYFSTSSARTFLPETMEIILLDNHGETYKDEIHSLIRLVAQKRT